METLASPFTKIFKRDGSIVDFNLDRIVDAIFNAAKAVGGKDYNLAVELAHQVLGQLQTQGDSQRVPTVEEIQDRIEKTLIERGHAQTAKAFILYRQKRKEVREIRSSFLAIEQTVDQYLEGEVSTSHPMTFKGLQEYCAQNILSHYALNKIYPPQISEAHRDGMIYIHGLGKALAGNSILLNQLKGDLEPFSSHIKRIQHLQSEWSDRIILEDFDEMEDFDEIIETEPGLLHFDPSEENSVKTFLFLKKIDFISELLKKKDPFKNLGMIFKGEKALEKNTSFPLVITPFKDIHQTSIMLGILPASTIHDSLRMNLGVVSLNLKRIAQESPFKNIFLDQVDYYLTAAKNALQIKKKIFDQNFNHGLFPQTKNVIEARSKGFLSIGLGGLFQAAHILSHGHTTESVLNLAWEIYHFTLEKLKSFEEETLQPFGLDFISGRFCPFYEEEPETLHEEALENTQFQSLLPWMTFKESDQETLQSLSKIEDFFFWVLPAMKIQKSNIKNQNDNVKFKISPLQ